MIVLYLSSPEVAGTALTFLRKGAQGETDPAILAKITEACTALNNAVWTTQSTFTSLIEMGWSGCMHDSDCACSNAVQARDSVILAEWRG